MTGWEMKGRGTSPKAFAFRIERGAKQLDAFAARSANNIAEHIANRGYANAPIYTGKLRASIWNTPAARITEGYVSVVKLLDDGVWYAPLMYAFLSPYAVFPIYNLGPISRKQPMTPEGGVGGQWFVRVANFHQKQHFQKLSEAVRKLFTTGTTTPLSFNP